MAFIRYTTLCDKIRHRLIFYLHTTVSASNSFEIPDRGRMVVGEL